MKVAISFGVVLAIRRRFVVVFVSALDRSPSP